MRSSTKNLNKPWTLNIPQLQENTVQNRTNHPYTQIYLLISFVQWTREKNNLPSKLYSQDNLPRNVTLWWLCNYSGLILSWDMDREILQMPSLKRVWFLDLLNTNTETTKLPECPWNNGAKALSCSVLVSLGLNYSVIKMVSQKSRDGRDSDPTSDLCTGNS